MKSQTESTTVLIALGLLAESPLHGHEIRQRFAERGISTFTPLTVGALYHALRVLEQRGLIAVRKTERVGARPERTVYEITARGRKSLKESLVMGLAALQRQHFVVDAALSQARNLAAEEITVALTERRLRQLELVRHLDDTAAAVAQRLEQVVPAGKVRRGAAIALGMSVIRHAQALARAELRWVDDTLAELTPTRARSGRARR